jgi:hypothetical protein
MKRLLLSSIVSAFAFAAMMPAQADEIQTTTQTIQETPQVVDSYMKPTVTQTKSVTTSDGNTQTSTAPMIMERHERVVVPSSEVRTTTTTAAPRVTTEEVTKSEARIAAPVRRAVKHHVAYKPRKHFVAYRHATPSRAIAVSQMRKTTIVEPQVIQQSQTIEQKDVVIDRKDPALEN